MVSFKLLLLYSFFIISNCSFQIFFFNQLNKKSNCQNLIISPTSIFQILSLTSNGAKGLTQEEMIETLQNSNINSLNSINYDLLKITKDFTTVEIANAVMTKFSPTKEFSDICENYFTSISKLESVEQINGWCSEKTHGKINKIIDQLDPDTVMILLNAVYFKGLWQYEFDNKTIAIKTFYNLNKEEIKVNTMKLLTSLRYYEDSNIQVVEIPYKEDEMSAIIILPQKDININTWINKISYKENNLYSIFDELDYQKVDLELPKFELEYEANLNQILQNLGMFTAFTGNADFTGIINGGGIYIDSVIHKAKYIR